MAQRIWTLPLSEIVLEHRPFESCDPDSGSEIRRLRRFTQIDGVGAGKRRRQMLHEICVNLRNLRILLIGIRLFRDIRVRVAVRHLPRNLAMMKITIAPSMPPPKIM